VKRNLILKQFIKNPGTIGALCPSSPALCKAMVSDINISWSRNVIELGPGTGAITYSILETIRPGTNFFTIELDVTIYEEFKKRFPHVKIYNDSASNMAKIIKTQGMDKVDTIISGLPWASFPYSLQREIMHPILESLRDGGYFTTFAYIQGVFIPSARRFRKILTENFSSVETSRVIWSNLPPAFVYRCRK
jgi:phospholipid N-methyltransferase